MAVIVGYLTLLPIAEPANMPAQTRFPEIAMPTAPTRWPARHIAILAYPDANSLDVVGPLQVFASAYIRLVWVMASLSIGRQCPGW